MNDICKPSAPLTILTALAAEAETLAGRKKKNQKENILIPDTHVPGGKSTVIIQCGIGRDRLLNTALPLLADTSVVGNIGISGGLAPDLASGTVILAEQIITRAQQQTGYQAIYAPDGQLLDILESTLKEHTIPYRRGSLLCTPHPLEHPADKAAAYLETGALAVDMESTGAAEAARQKGLPFCCIRVICDPASRRVEKKLFDGVDNQGNNRPSQLIRPLIRQPWLIASLVSMARDFNRGLIGMRQVWSVVHKPLLDFADN